MSEILLCRWPCSGTTLSYLTFITGLWESKSKCQALALNGMLVLICCPSTGSSADTVHWSLWFSGIGDRRRVPNGRKHCLFWSLPSHPGRTHRSWSRESSFAGNPQKPSVEWIFLCVFFFPQPYREICRWLIPTNQFSETTAMMMFKGEIPRRLTL